MKVSNVIIRLVILTLAAAMMTSCHSKRHTVRGDRGHRVEQSNPYDYHPRSKGKGKADAVINLSMEWLGVSYKYGGNNRKGVDCSGLTCAVFRDAAGIDLPRDSRSQASYCKKIDRKKLRPGDLVFFTSRSGGNRINHVALYIGDNKIIHSTTSRGVIISDLDEKYWRQHYYMSGRVPGLDK